MAAGDHRHQDFVEDVALTDDALGDFGAKTHRGREQCLAVGFRAGRDGGAQRTARRRR
jgi:hypothetical protein